MKKIKFLSLLILLLYSTNSLYSISQIKKSTISEYSIENQKKEVYKEYFDDVEKEI